MDKTKHTITQSYLSNLTYRMGLDRDTDATDMVPIGKIVSDLVLISEADWWKYAFLHEPIRGALSDSDCQALIQRAIECGRKYANWYIEKYGAFDPAMIAKKLDIAIEMGNESRNGGRIVFAEFVVPNTIRVYTEGVNRGRELLEQSEVRNVLGTGFSISDVLIGHELYHVIEDRNKDAVWTRAHKRTLWGFGRFRYKSQIACLSEIGAMAFTKRLNGLSWSPYLLDALLVYSYSKRCANDMYKSMIH